MRARGFTLLEVIVALTIVGIGFSAVFAAMSGSVRSIQRIEVNDTHVEQARFKLAQLDLVKAVRPNDSASGTFEDGTRWTLRTSSFIAPVDDGQRSNSGSVIRVDLTLEWMGRNGIQRRVVESYRYQQAQSTPIPSLEEQLREIE